MRGTLKGMSATFSSIKSVVASGLRSGRQANHVGDEVTEDPSPPPTDGDGAGGSASTGGVSGQRDAVRVFKEAWGRYSATSEAHPERETRLLAVLDALQGVASHLPDQGCKSLQARSFSVATRCNRKD